VPFWPIRVLDDGRVYAAAHLYSFKEQLNEKTFKDISPVSVNKTNELKDLIAQSHLVDNPYIMIVSLKNEN
jgi:hypothetical protein